MVGTSQDHYLSGTRLEGTERSSRGQSLQRDKGRKRQFVDLKPMTSAKRVKKEYAAKEKANYKAMKAVERKGKKEGWVALKGEVKHTMWDEAHEGLNQKCVDRRKNDNEYAE